MDLFEIRWKRSAIKELRGLPSEVVRKIHTTVDSLVSDPFPPSSKKLVGSTDSYRIRLGDYRIVYSVYSGILTIEIIRIGHRQGIYKR